METQNQDIRSKIKDNLKKPKTIIAIIIGLVFSYAVYDIFFRGDFKPPLPKNIYLSGDSTISDANMLVKKENTTNKDSIAKANKNKPIEEVGKVTGIFVIHEVKKGEILNLISKRYHLNNTQILKENNLTSENLKVGQKLKIPIKAKHKVRSGETLNSLVKKYNVKKEFIMTSNNMIKESDLKAGKDVIIPL